MLNLESFAIMMSFKTNELRDAIENESETDEISLYYVGRSPVS